MTKGKTPKQQKKKRKRKKKKKGKKEKKRNVTIKQKILRRIKQINN